MANREALGTMTDSAATLVEAQMVRFARALHDNAFAVGAAEIADALRALGSIAATDMRQVRNTLRTLFVSSEREWRRFDDIFDAFWPGMARKRRSVQRQGIGAASGQPHERGGHCRKGGTLADYFDWARNVEDNRAATSQGRAGGVSASESAAKADFGKVTDPQEMQRLHALAEQWAARIRYRLSRRR
jgi:uncharacterized protein with von Willebrand factor type A (vWA) domain